MQNLDNTLSFDSQNHDLDMPAMHPVFRKRKNLLYHLLRMLFLLAVVGMAIYIFFRLRQQKTTPASPQLAATDSLARATTDAHPPTPPPDTLTVNDEPTAAATTPPDTPGSFAELASAFHRKNIATTVLSQQPLRQGLRHIENGQFARAIPIFEAVLDTSTNEQLSAEADYYLLLALLGNCPRSQAAYQQQLDKMLEQKNHLKFRQAAAVKRAASALWRRK